MSLPIGLLEAAKNYLDITWDDDAGDDKLSGILARGMTTIDDIAGAPQDYSAETRAKALLFDYCRYAMANALQDFQGDFSGELMAIRILTEVMLFEANANL